MKIYSWNTNGIRSIYNKGFIDWLNKTKPDILCTQEIKASTDQIPAEIIKPKGYFSYFNPAQKKGYSGLSVFSKEKPKLVKNNINYKKFDTQGRILELHYKNFILFNFYMPQGARDKSKLPFKLESYKYLFKYLNKFKNKKLILIGDFNIAHQEIDLARPENNKNNIMFTPEERQQIDILLSLGFIDSYRYLNPKKEEYTWWPYFRQCRKRNIGWRIDYCFVSNNLKTKLKKAQIHTNVMGSDHCPISLEV